MSQFKKTCLTIIKLLLTVFIGLLSMNVIIHFKTRNGIPVVGYHGVVEDNIKNKDYARNPYFMSASEFEKQMKYLSDNNYETLFMDDVYDYYLGNRNVSKKTICITFDDGYTNFNSVVKPILEKYNLKATCFVIGSKTIKGNKKYLQQGELNNDAYVEYYSHSYDLHHLGIKKGQKLIETLSVEEIKQDFSKNKNLVSTEYFAFPYGRSCDHANTYLNTSDVRLAFSYNQFRHMTRNDDRYYLPRYLMFAHMPFFLYQYYIN